MFCEEIIGKIKFRAFPKRVGPRILSLESVDYFGTSEHYCVVEKIKIKIRILISKTAMVGCCKLSLYANGLVMTIEAHEFSCIYTRVQQSLLTRVLNQFRHK